MNSTPHTVNVPYVNKLLAEIQRREQRKRYYDAAEGQQWFREQVAREANEDCLRTAYARLKEALVCTQGEHA